MVRTQTVTIHGSIPHQQHVNVQSKVPKTYGVAWPVGRDGGTYFGKASGYKLIRSNIIQLLLTGLGERVMLPNYGTNLKSMLFENLSPLDLTEIEEQIRDAIKTYLPKAIVKSVRVGLTENGDSTNTPLETSQLRIERRRFQTSSNAYLIRISVAYPDLEDDIFIDLPVLDTGRITGGDGFDPGGSGPRGGSADQGGY